MYRAGVGPRVKAQSIEVADYIGIGPGPLPSTGGLRLSINYGVVSRTTGGTDCPLAILDGSNVMRFGSTASTFNVIQVGAGGGVFCRVNATDQATFNATGVAFNGATPAARPTYTVTNHTDDRALNETADTLAQSNNVKGTVINDAKAIGLFQ